MNSNMPFADIVETMYNLPLEEREELRNLLEHNIVESRREEMKLHFNSAQAQEKSGALKFSSDLNELKKML
jgi:hypothetical protein